VTASQTLRKLDEACRAHTNGTDYVWPKLFDALPALIDVVEEAEFILPCRANHVGLRVALASLQAALGETP
jgi:hypothetical protein